ncbi:endonuclease V, partial [candidate division WOR-3 bacterium]|nr:endonuclease V [candidate division WOR-3 bacterium]
IGCAKSRLIGEYEEMGLEKGSMSTLSYMGRVVGCVLRTKTKVKPLFISPGNLITLGEAVEIITGCIRGRRIPEPVRIADIRSKELKRLS